MARRRFGASHGEARSGARQRQQAGTLQAGLCCSATLESHPLAALYRVQKRCQDARQPADRVTVSSVRADWEPDSTRQLQDAGFVLMLRRALAEETPSFAPSETCGSVASGLVRSLATVNERPAALEVHKHPNLALNQTELRAELIALDAFLQVTACQMALEEPHESWVLTPHARFIGLGLNRVRYGLPPRRFLAQRLDEYTTVFNSHRYEFPFVWVNRQFTAHASSAPLNHVLDPWPQSSQFVSVGTISAVNTLRAFRLRGP